MAIKTMVFQSRADQIAQAASETAIASNLAHPNMVTTYCHDLQKIDSSTELLSGSCKIELRLYKLYLIQVGPFFCLGLLPPPPFLMLSPHSGLTGSLDFVVYWLCPLLSSIVSCSASKPSAHTLQQHKILYHIDSLQSVSAVCWRDMYL